MSVVDLEKSPKMIRICKTCESEVSAFEILMGRCSDCRDERIAREEEEARFYRTIDDEDMPADYDEPDETEFCEDCD